MIEVRELKKSFDSKEALKGINFKVAEGEVSKREKHLG